MVKGALHVHSTYSDGERTLAELRALFRDADCAFVCVTDHADAFTAERVLEYRAECESLSTPDFTMVPGLEFGCDRRMHVIGYGVTRLCESTDPQEVIAHIAACGGISVIAHPQDAAFSWIESFETLPDGIEVWNTKYDGQYAPRARTFRLLERLRSRRPDMLAFYGQDLHWLRQYRSLYTQVDAAEHTAGGLLAAIRRGAFRGEKADLVLPSSGKVDASLLARFERVNGRWMRVRAVLRSANALVKRFGATVPAPVKARLRRVF